MTDTATGWTFRKSSRSTADEKCVELGCTKDGGMDAVRDSKNPTGPVLTGALQVGAFVQMVKTGTVG